MTQVIHSVPQPPLLGAPFNLTWVRLLKDVLTYGARVAPRGQPTTDLLAHAFSLRADQVVLTLPERQLNYSLAAAEALWTCDGDDRVATLAPFSSEMAQYSDDGETFFGAYGPPIAGQLDYVESVLTHDDATRQAVIEVWRPNPPHSLEAGVTTKNPPCTVALLFQVREGRLHCQLLLRASDVWLGLPYDVFTVVCVMAKLLCRLNRRRLDAGQPTWGLGTVYVYAGTAQVYDKHRDQAQAVVSRYCAVNGLLTTQQATPLSEAPLRAATWDAVEADLRLCRDRVTATSPTHWDVRPQWSCVKLLRAGPQP